MKCTLLTLAAILLTAASARANTITQTLDTPTLGTAGSATDWTISLLFNQFDPAVGTLNSVSVTLAGSMSDSGTLKNNGAGSATFSYVPFVDISLHAPSSLQSLQADVSANTGSLTLDAGATTPFNLSSSLSNNASFTSATALNQFTGTGTILVNPLTTSGSIISGGGGNVSVTSRFFAEADVTVVYNFTPATASVVPLPPAALAAAPLLGLLAAGKFLRRARR